MRENLRVFDYEMDILGFGCAVLSMVDPLEFFSMTARMFQ
jgi:hypothetical protein